MRTTIFSLVIMIGVVFGVNIVNAAMPLPNDSGAVAAGPGGPVGPATGPNNPPVNPGPVAAGAGVKVGAGVVIYPPDGWTVVGVESGLTVFQKGNVVLIVAGLPWKSTPVDLATQYRDAWFKSGQFTANDPQSVALADGVPGAALSYTGVFQGTTVDGAIVAGVKGGNAVVLNVFGAQGALDGVKSDLGTIFSTIQFTGEPG